MSKGQLLEQKDRKMSPVDCRFIEANWAWEFGVIDKKTSMIKKIIWSGKTFLYNQVIGQL